MISTLRPKVIDLFNLRHMKAKNKTKEQLVKDLHFAYNSALVTHSLGAMQDLLTAFAEVPKIFGLTINIKKTKVLIQDTQNTKLNLREVLLNGTPLAEVDEFTYLDSNVTRNTSTDAKKIKKS